MRVGFENSVPRSVRMTWKSRAKSSGPSSAYSPSKTAVTPDDTDFSRPVQAGRAGTHESTFRACDVSGDAPIHLGE